MSDFVSESIQCSVQADDSSLKCLSNVKVMIVLQRKMIGIFFFLKKKILFTCTTARVCPISMRSSDLRMCMILAAMTRALLS